MTSLRIDKWLWAARFFKTRALAVEAIEKHRVRLNGAHTKPSKEVHAGDELEIAQGPVLRTVRVLGVSATRGPAPQAALLYSETEASVAQRLAQAEQRRLAPEPAHQSTLAPDAFTMPAHFDSSALLKAANSAGVLPTGSAPSFSN